LEGFCHQFYKEVKHTERHELEVEDNSDQESMAIDSWNRALWCANTTTGLGREILFDLG
jgi:hypothetical protein